MALFDYQLHEQNMARLSAYNQAKEKLKSDNPLALDEILRLEAYVKEREAKIRDYENFFGALAMFLPKEPSIFDKIG